MRASEEEAMRIVLISDIHGNTVALDAVLAEVSGQSYDAVVCLGDIAAGGPDPRGALDRVMDTASITVQGNTDTGMVEMPAWWRDPSSIGLPASATPGLEISVWAASQLTAEHAAAIGDLPLSAEVELGGAGVMLAFHGSPRAADDYITATTTAEELEEMFDGSAHGVLAGGHTHVPLVRQHGTQTLVNPGSVGMPFAGYGFAGGVRVLDHASYAVLTTDASRLNIELRQVAVDVNRLEDSVAHSGMPHGEWWLGLRGSTTDGVPST